MEGLGSKKSKQHQRQAELLAANTDCCEMAVAIQRKASYLTHEQIRLPFAFHRPHHVLDKGDVVRAEGAEEKSHSRFVGRAIPFAIVAPDARTNQVLPSVAATA